MGLKTWDIKTRDKKSLNLEKKIGEENRELK